MDITTIISEEINNFDFLNTDKYATEDETIRLLSNRDLQKQIVCDMLLNKRDKYQIKQIKDATVHGNWEGSNFDDASRMTLTYNVEVEYKYDSTKSPLTFDLYFNGVDIPVSVEGRVDYNNPNNDDSWFNTLSFEEVDVTLNTVDGDEIRFDALDEAPDEIRKIFIEDFVGDFIYDQTSTNNNDIPNKNAIAQYC
jgi:hypothetical protein